MKYDFMNNNNSKHCIRKMAEILEVSRSGYYAWKTRSQSKRSITNETLVKNIKGVFKKSRKRYGSPRVHAELCSEGVYCNLKTVAKIMNHHGLIAQGRKKYRPTTNSRHNHPIAPNHLDRKFSVSSPNKVWVSDITYISTEEGWQYLCVIIDLFNREIVGWALDYRMKQELVITAIHMAIQKKRSASGLIFHSDRGSQYAAKSICIA